MRADDADVELPDFLDFAAAGRDLAVFECSSTSDDGDGSVAVTPTAVYLGEPEGIVRIEASDIRWWRSASRGLVFALTVESGSAHVTYLLNGFRPATVSAMVAAFGPEGELLRPAG